MNGIYASLRRLSGNDSRVLKTVHILCAVICATLACSTLWLSNQPNEVLQSDMELPLRVEEAEGLVANATQWTREWKQEKAGEVSLQRAAAKAISWIPRQLDWQRTMGDLQALAVGCDLLLVEIRPGEEFDGSRVAIRTAMCQVEGTYEAICQFLDGLVKLEHPVWASELTMQNNAKGEPLAVVIHLRIPMAGTRTASAYLIEKLQPLSATQTLDPRTSKRNAVVRAEAPQHG